MDIKGKRLVDAATYHSVPLSVTRAPAPHLHAVASTTDQFDKLLEEFPEITTPNFTQTQAKHGVEHFITTQGPPVYARACRLPPRKLLAVKSEFSRMEAMGIIRHDGGTHDNCFPGHNGGTHDNCFALIMCGRPSGHSFKPGPQSSTFPSSPSGTKCGVESNLERALT